MKNQILNKIGKSFVSVALALIMVLGAGTAIADTSAVNGIGVVASAATVKLSATKKTVYYDSSTTLKVKNTKKTVKWSSKNTKVATVNSKGKVTGKGLGTTYIYAKVSGKTYKCKVTVKDRNQTASKSFKVSDGGSFIKGESTAKVTVKLKKYKAAKAYVYIKNSSGDTVYKKTLTNLAKNKSYSFSWSGKNSKGKYVSAGSYRVLVKVGETKTYTPYLKFITKNDFADGNGSKSNPFEITTESQLKKIVKYPNAYFKQINDLDFEYEAVGGFFSEDQPFNGTYDGNGKTISNISGTEALFECVGEKGTIKNVVMKNCSVVGQDTALVVKHNYGKIQNSNIDGFVSAQKEVSTNAGHIALYNYGTISGCVSTGSVSTSINRAVACAGGIVAINEGTGKIISCYSHANVSAVAPTGGNWSYSGGVAANNGGLIKDCEVDGTISGQAYDVYSGSIVGRNTAQIINCCYTGQSVLNMAGQNSGMIA